MQKRSQDMLLVLFHKCITEERSELVYLEELCKLLGTHLFHVFQSLCVMAPFPLVTSCSSNNLPAKVQKANDL